jgi:hypothetical protein
VGDTSNWEFAAVVAAVSIGLCGLLVFTLVSIFTDWRVLDRAAKAAQEATSASLLVQDLAREIATREAASAAAVTMVGEGPRLSELRAQADALVQQQALLQDAVRNLVEAGVLRSEGDSASLQELQASVRRLDEHMGQVAAALAAMRRET